MSPVAPTIFTEPAAEDNPDEAAEGSHTAGYNFVFSGSIGLIPHSMTVVQGGIRKQGVNLLIQPTYFQNFVTTIWQISDCLNYLKTDTYIP